MLERFIKKAYISFYEDDKFFLQIDIVKNKKVISSEKKEFEKKEDMLKEILNIKEDYSQYYISTFIQTINQGVIPSCAKNEYKKREIDINNIKYICIKNKYSFYISLYDLINIKKEYEIDFLYSIFAPIDFFVKNKNNIIYILILKKGLVILGYEKNLPIYSDITPFDENEENVNEEDLEVIDDIDLEIDEEISEDIEEESENIDIEDINEESNIEKTSIEYNVIEILKNSVKDYYENYSTEFLEKIVFLDTINLDNSLIKIVNDELLLNCEIIKFDLLDTINKMSERENV